MKNFKQLITVSFLVLFAFSAIAGNSGKKLASGQKDIIDTAHNAGGFSTLIEALKAADLVDTLRGQGPYTVFAPTDAAFAKLPAGTLDDLLKPENKNKLSEILQYHVVRGKVKTNEVIGMDSINTLEGSDIDINVADNAIMLNGSGTFSDTNVEAVNGIIHVVDTVLMPPIK